MRRVRKLVALLLSLAMVLAMSGMAMAATSLSGGEVGGFENPDEPKDNITKAVSIQKEIKVYNPDEDSVYAPEITYTYSIAAASATDGELVTVTDDTGDHGSGTSVTTTVLPGVGASDVVLTGTAANVIALTNADVLDAASNGASNIKYLEVDFSNVVFSGPGVYRYKITENVTYANTGVTDGSILNYRYLDVYVMRSTSFVASHDGTSGNEFVKDDWYIYGYVCISPESVATNAGGKTNVTTSTAKTNGFVSETIGNTEYTPDAYYTYNFTVSKDLVGDDGMNSHLFPITVAFDNENGPKGNFSLMASYTSGKSSIDTGAVAAYSGPLSSAFNNPGGPKLADEGSIKYIGIPNAIVVTVTETNDVVGTTYKATVKEDTDGNGLVAVAFTSSTGELSTDSKTSSISNGKTASRTAATGGTVDTIAKNVQIEFTNTLETISPTGLMFRYGPYVLILICGVVLLFLGVKFMRRNKEED